VVIEGEALQRQHDEVTPTGVLCRVDVEGDGHQTPYVVDAGGMGMKAGDGGGLHRVDGGDKGRCLWCCRRTLWRWQRGDTTELSNLELEGGRHIPGLLSRGADYSGMVMGDLGSSVEGRQGIGGESRSLRRGGSACGSRFLGRGELLSCHVLGVGGAPMSGGGGKPNGGEAGSLGDERDGILRGGLGRHGFGRGAATRGRELVASDRGDRRQLSDERRQLGDGGGGEDGASDCGARWARGREGGEEHRGERSAAGDRRRRRWRR
jgi:hypothetical protein